MPGTGIQYSLWAWWGGGGDRNMLRISDLFFVRDLLKRINSHNKQKD